MKMSLLLHDLGLTLTLVRLRFLKVKIHG